MKKPGQPNLASDEMDPQRQRVYDAEEKAFEIYYTEYEEEELSNLQPDELEIFATTVLDKAKLHYDDLPVFRLDIPVDLEYSGLVEGNTREIRLHPQTLTRQNVLHELAHWVTDFPIHGPIFTALHVRLVRAGIGDKAAEVLLENYRAYSVEVLGSLLEANDD